MKIPDSEGDMRICDAFTSAMRETLAEGMRKIEHCAGQLRELQFWHRPRAEMNSIANLCLHLTGNLRQWIISGVGGAEDVRNRPLEFSDRSNRGKSEVLVVLNGTVKEADEILSRLQGGELVAARRIQGFDTTVLSAVVNTVSHFRGHVQEIIHMTREQLGEKYRFDFVPRGKEQESGGGGV
jgi:Protein of unknown function (DUF1572)